MWPSGDGHIALKNSEYEHVTMAKIMNINLLPSWILDLEILAAC